MFCTYWAYELPDQTVPDTQIFQTGPAQRDWIQTYISKHFTYQAWITNFDKVPGHKFGVKSK